MVAIYWYELGANTTFDQDSREYWLSTLWDNFLANGNWSNYSWNGKLPTPKTFTFEPPRYLVLFFVCDDRYTYSERLVLSCLHYVAFGHNVVAFVFDPDDGLSHCSRFGLR